MTYRDIEIVNGLIKNIMTKHKIISFCGIKATGKTTSAGFLKFLLSTPKFLHYYWIYKMFPKLKLKGN